jgi:hypothetical protein
VEKTSPSEAQKKSLDNEKESQEAPPKSAANSLHHFDSPPASGAPKELEVLLHGKPNQFLVKGIRKDFLVTILVLVAIFFVVYFFVGPAYTH